MSRKERPRAAREPRRRSGAHSSLLAFTPSVPHREPWQPSPYARLVGPVLLPEQPRQRGLFIPDDERVRGEEEQSQVAKQRQRSVEDRGSDQRKACSDVHRIANVPIRSDDHETTRRIERGRRSLADCREREDAPERQRATGHADEKSRDLPKAKPGGRDYSGRLEDAPREEDQEQADKQGGVGRRTGKNERIMPCLLFFSAPGVGQDRLDLLDQRLRQVDPPQLGLE